MSKKKKIVLVIAVLLVIGLGVGAFLYLKKKEEDAPAISPVFPSKDIDGNHIELSPNKSTQYPDTGFAVLVNGIENGALATLVLSADGYYRGSTNQGVKYKYQQGWVRE